MKKKLRTLTKEQIEELKSLLLSLDSTTLSVIYSYTRGLIQVSNSHDRAKK